MTHYTGIYKANQSRERQQPVRTKDIGTLMVIQPKVIKHHRKNLIFFNIVIMELFHGTFP